MITPRDREAAILLVYDPDRFCLPRLEDLLALLDFIKEDYSMTQTKRRSQTKPAATPSQASAFISSMHNSGWRSINDWEDGGHTFELLGRNGKTVLVQIYPERHGFQVWRPVTEANNIDETRMAVEEYGGLTARTQEEKDLAEYEAQLARGEIDLNIDTHEQLCKAALLAAAAVCPHHHLNEEGICRACGADRRGI